MKLYELLTLEYLANHCKNIRCELDIQTTAIKQLYAIEYDGKKHYSGGVYGRMMDIPAIYGGYEIMNYRYTNVASDRVTLHITI